MGDETINFWGTDSIENWGTGADEQSAQCIGIKKYTTISMASERNEKRIGTELLSFFHHISRKKANDIEIKYFSAPPQIQYFAIINSA